MKAPITLSLIAVNAAIFGLNHLRLLGAPFIMRPGRIDIHAALAHWSHLDVFHILMNMYLLWMIGPWLERTLTPVQYITVVVGIWLLLILFGYAFAKNPSLGFSGIGLGLMTFVALLFWGQGDVSQQLLKWVGINIVIGFLPGISFAMHALGAVSGGLMFAALRLIKFL